MAVPQPTAPAPAPFAFVQQGVFSGTNAALLAELGPALGRAPLLIDTHDYRRLSRGSLLNVPPRNVRSHLREFGHLATRNPREFVAKRLETSFMFEERSRIARAAVRATDAPFVMQTMTMFNAKTDERPLFMYTDHTVLAMRRYGAFSEPVTGRERWIELERRTYADCDLIFTTSDFARQSIVEDYEIAGDRVIDVRSGTNSAVPDRPTEHRATPRQIAFVGKQWERKGGPLLVKAFRAARQKHPTLTLVIAGCSPDLAEDGITVLGRITPAEVSALLVDSDIFALPSTVEPSAIVYSEASAHCLPVLATTVGGTPERVLHEETGLLSPAGDPEALTANLLRLLEEPGLATTLGQAGFRLVAERFTWAGTARTIADAIDASIA